MPALVFVLAACGLTRPDIVLVTIDTLRSDHCSAYGYPLDTPPNLSAIAGAGALFETAYAPMPVTAPSHATILTSLYPLSHGVIRNGMILAERHTTLAEILARHGYRTDAVVSSCVLNRKFGLDQGFRTYSDHFPPEGATISGRPFRGYGPRPDGGFDRRADATTDVAVERIKARTSDPEPYFLFVHYMDPHRPYVPPESFQAEFAPRALDPNDLEREIGLYDGEIVFTDRELGRLVEAIDESGQPEGTLLVVTGDHGEGLMRHGKMGHGFDLHEESVRVPLVCRWPGRIKARQIVSEPIGADRRRTDAARAPRDRDRGRELSGAQPCAGPRGESPGS